MEQLSLYDYVDRFDDPIYRKLTHVSANEEVIIGTYMVTINDIGLYEITSDERHEAANDLDDCYRKLIYLINNEGEII